MRPEQILQKLIRFDTTNPPGNEKPCIQYIAGLDERIPVTALEFGTEAIYRLLKSF